MAAPGPDRMTSPALLQVSVGGDRPYPITIGAGAQADGAALASPVRGRPGLLVGPGAAAEVSAGSLSTLLGRDGIRDLDAVKQHRAYGIWHAFYNSPYNVVAIEAMTKWLYPERAAALAPQASLDALYRQRIMLSTTTAAAPAIAAAPEDPIAAYRRTVRKRLLLTAVLVLAIAASLLADIASGPAALSPADLLQTLLHPDAASAGTRVIVWQFRLPYALMALLVGVALGLGGAEMQTMLDNPLASPYTLGVSAAAAFGASLAITLDWHLPALPPGMVVSISAFACTLVSVLILERVARWRGGRW
ncbi:hypothetical protein G6F65_016861 [Rhizopus arrhizus]|nr:hypothetical protein G6F65_016861 [Rhizopus arrhizus]